jgi:hypothetical protein
MSSLIILAQDAATNIHRAGTFIAAASALSYLSGRFITPLNLSGEYCAKFTAIVTTATIAFFTTSRENLDDLGKEKIPFLATLVCGATYLTCHLSGFEKTWPTLAKTGTVVALAIFGNLVLFATTSKKNSSSAFDKGSAMLANGCSNIQRIALAGASAWAFNKIMPLSFKSEHTAPLAMLASAIYYLAQPFFEAADKENNLTNQGNRAISWLFLTKVAANYLNISTPWKQSSVALVAALIPEVLAAVIPRQKPSSGNTKHSYGTYKK